MSNHASPSTTRDVATSASVKIRPPQANRLEDIMPYISTEDIEPCPLPHTSGVVQHDITKKPSSERTQSLPYHRQPKFASLRKRFARGKTCPNLNHLPNEEEEEEEEEKEEVSTKIWSKLSLRRRTSQPWRNAGNCLLTTAGSCCEVSSGDDGVNTAKELSEKEKNLRRVRRTGRVGAWATNFNTLLSDPAGLRTFTRFLKEELSHENIDFWLACENYRQLKTIAERRVVAREIAERHILPECPNPLSIGAFMCQSILDNLDKAEPDLFAKSHGHIYELMKFDSFARFRQSDIYKESFMAEIDGLPLPMEAT